jgi:hypothetical protein
VQYGSEKKSTRISSFSGARKPIEWSSREEQPKQLTHLPHLAIMMRMIDATIEIDLVIATMIAEEIKTKKVMETFCQCLVSILNSSIYFTALTLFDTGAYTSSDSSSS